MSRNKRSKLKKPLSSEDSYQISILRSDMTEEMQKESLTLAKEIFQEAQASGAQLVQKDLAAKLKKKFDSTYPNSTWHCIIGSDFASSITHQTKHCIIFQANQQKILLFKTTE